MSGLAVVVLVGRSVLAVACLGVLLTPAWWLARAFLEREEGPVSAFWRLLWAAGIALVGYVSFVNLAGRAFDNSTTVASVYLAINAVTCAILWRRDAARVSWLPLFASWRQWIVYPIVACIAAFPQWWFAISANYYDEAASSSIHLTAANQFAEGVFPPRHNALPDVVVKYHYGFTILSGTVRWLTGLSANISVDVASTCLWVFLFLFVICWFAQMGFSRVASAWGAGATLYGGGLAWVYLRRVEAYAGVAKFPDVSELQHKWDANTSWMANLIADARVPALHLRNADGTLSNLPWDVAAQFQQHAVALGLTLTVFSFALFVAWQRDSRGVRIPLMIANVIAFGLLPLAHAAFGAMGALTAGLWLLFAWLRHRTRAGFMRGLFFGVGVAVLTLLHGGLFARGPQYGGDAVATFRHVFGYSAGGVSGFIHWNIAGFGVPLALTLLAWGLHRWRRDPAATDRNNLFGLLTVLGVVSWCIPQFMYYSSDTIGAEQFTEISKFFFIARLAFALLSVYGVAYVLRNVHWGAAVVLMPAMMLSPFAVAYSGSLGSDGRWMGFYRGPYRAHSVEAQMGDTLRVLKHGPRDVYFDASADERVHGYLGELLVRSGSIFTLTPSRYERTGVGYRLAERVIAERLVQNSRMARLQPGAAEACACSWYYARPATDISLAPLLVRSRFEKLVSSGTFTQVFALAPRALYEIRGSTANVDAGLELHWRPVIVTQPRHRGATELMFLDRTNNQIIVDGRAVPLPAALNGQSLQVYTGQFAGARGQSLVVGHMRDTYFHLGARIEELVERNDWAWNYRAAGSAAWLNEYPLWAWDLDIPFVADLDNDGVDSHVALRARTGEWLAAPNLSKLAGPSASAADLPVPFGGRFLAGSRGDLGVWSLAAGTVTLRSLSSGDTESFRWGGRPGDVLVPGDYDGDGIDEIGVWQRTNVTWYWRRVPNGAVSQATYGTPTSVPMPSDYNGDGRLDLAYWEPAAGKIFVSFTLGKTTDRVIAVPAGSIPAFVNMN